ncbi:hypothetical protein QE358_003815 [Sphingomonas sp. SORGH_AS742]|nr:hypothetical protein [Sphingomonas sp. SORGH_AS_0742]
MDHVPHTGISCGAGDRERGGDIDLLKGRRITLAGADAVDDTSPARKACRRDIGIIGNKDIVVATCGPTRDACSPVTQMIGKKGGNPAAATNHQDFRIRPHPRRYRRTLA